MLEEIEFEDLEELRKKEEEYRSKLNANLNEKSCYRSEEDYKEYMKEYNNEYYENNKDKILEYGKEYRQDNKEQIKENKKNTVKIIKSK